MSRHYVRRVIAFLGILVAAASSTHLALAQYAWVNPTTNSALWADAVNWANGPVGTFPNAVGATALINAPMRTGGSGNFNLTMPASNVTVGSITIDNTNHSNNFRSNFTNGGDDFRLIFEVASGSAMYTETVGSAAGATNSQYQFLGKVRVNSDLIINQDNYPNLNTGTTFSNLVEGPSTSTITKEGHGGIQFNYNHLPGEETPFQGDVVINQGGIRLISVNPFVNVSGITVNSGGQLMLADNTNNDANTDWNLASGAILNLNGAGKATDSPFAVANPEGALRITNTFVTSTTFHHPVVLQSDSVISVSVAALTGTLAETVTGLGGLTKHGAGTLALSNGGNSYDGDTTILGGTLSITSSFLENSADVYLTTGSVFNLGFSGTDTIRSLFVDGVPQAIGTYGAADLGGLLIAGSGTLTVTEVPVIGLDGDHNADGVVDAADYVLWRKDPGNFGGDPGGYNEWVANFGESEPGSGNNAPVPEPTTCLSIFLAVMLGVMSRRHR